MELIQQADTFIIPDKLVSVILLIESVELHTLYEQTIKAGKFAYSYTHGLEYIIAPKNLHNITERSFERLPEFLKICDVLEQSLIRNMTKVTEFNQEFAIVQEILMRNAKKYSYADDKGLSFEEIKRHASYLRMLAQAFIAFSGESMGVSHYRVTEGRTKELKCDLTYVDDERETNMMWDNTKITVQ